jgi:Na+-translocating ferredoxin:NAD+ oxidoreductase RnfA subunit
MTSYLFVIIGAVLVNNVVLVRILGLCPFMGVSKKLETAVGMGAATTFVLTLGCGTSYLVDHYVLMPAGVEYLRTWPSSSSSPPSCRSPSWSSRRPARCCTRCSASTCR